MALRAYQLYQGNDWQTHRYSAAQVYDLLDQLRDVATMALAPDGYQPLALLHDLCSDLVGAVDLALADLSVTLQQHLPSRWLMVELRTLAAGLPEAGQSCVDDQDHLPELADRAERIRHLLHRLDN